MIEEEIASLENRELDEIERQGLGVRFPSSSRTAVPSPTPLLRLLEDGGGRRQLHAARFLRVESIAGPSSSSGIEPISRAEDLLVSLHGVVDPLWFIICGSETEYDVGWILSAASSKALNASRQSDLLSEGARRTIEACHPGASVVVASFDRLSAILQSTKFAGLATGVPPPIEGLNGVGFKLERLLQGLGGDIWWYIVAATPLSPEEVSTMRGEVMREIQTYSREEKVTLQDATRDSRQLQTEEQVDRSVRRYLELLETLFSRFNLGQAKGLWRVTCMFGSTTAGVYQKAASLVRSVFTSAEATTEPNHVLGVRDVSGLIGRLLNGESLPVALDADRHQVEGGERESLNDAWRMQPRFDSFLTSGELAQLAHLPTEEVPGIPSRRLPRFGVNPPRRVEGSGARSIELGGILDQGRRLRSKLVLSQDDLLTHSLVAGVTGSGKTSTCVKLLRQLDSKCEIPFLVIEPTKREYRSRLQGTRGLRVFTVGDDSVAPLRFNPFEVPPMVNPYKHIDMLKSVFRVSFPMDHALPYVTELCLLNVYQSRGWDVTLGTRGDTPSMNDLYAELPDVVLRLGYDTETTGNLLAALQTRIRSLLIGGKGGLLNSRASMSIPELLKSPTVLELSSLGDDDDKAFFMGLLLGSIHEFLEVNSAQNSGLRHVTLIEEAHRLLMRSSSALSADGSVGNPKAKAIESFCNMLSELRVYGEGLIIVDQVPAKLAPDAIKNTNVKIVHRIVAGDDRGILAEAMGLSADQRDGLIALELGNAVISFERLPNPTLVSLIEFEQVDGPGQSGEPSRSVFTAGSAITTDPEVRSLMAESFFPFHPALAPKTHLPFPGCEGCVERCRHRFAVETLLRSSDLMEAFARATKTVPAGNKRYEAILREVFAPVARLRRSKVDLTWETYCLTVQLMNLGALPRPGSSRESLEAAIRDDAVGFSRYLSTGNRLRATVQRYHGSGIEPPS